MAAQTTGSTFAVSRVIRLGFDVVELRGLEATEDGRGIERMLE